MINPIKITMNAAKKNGDHKVSKTITYPQKTTGSQVAAKARKVTNKLDEQTRAALFEKGMQIIYGGAGNKKTVRS